MERSSRLLRESVLSLPFLPRIWTECRHLTSASRTQNQPALVSPLVGRRCKDSAAAKQGSHLSDQVLSTIQDEQSIWSPLLTAVSEQSMTPSEQLMPEIGISTHSRSQQNKRDTPYKTMAASSANATILTNLLVLLG